MQNSSSIAIYPGSFDPLTLGHLDIIQRSHKLFSTILVAVAKPVHKRTLFSVEERIRFIEEATRSFSGVRVKKLEGLLIEFARAQKAKVVIRGLRAVSDLEYEFKMAWLNRKLYPDLETLFLLPSEEYAYLASSLVKEVARLGGPVRGLVPDHVAERLEAIREEIRGVTFEKEDPIL